MPLLKLYFAPMPKSAPNPVWLSIGLELPVSMSNITPPLKKKYFRKFILAVIGIFIRDISFPYPV